MLFPPHPTSRRAAFLLALGASLSLTFALTVTPAWAVNKCSSASGKITFSDLPCEASEQKSLVKPSTNAAAPAAGSSPAPASKLTALERELIEAEKDIKDPQLKAQCQALFKRVNDFSKEKPGQQTPAAEVQTAKAQLEERCGTKMRRYVDAARKVLDEQDRLDDIKSAESARVYCEKQKNVIEAERAKLAGTNREKTRGLEFREWEYKEQCKP